MRFSKTRRSLAPTRLTVETLESRDLLSALHLCPLVQVSGLSPFAGSTADNVASQPGSNTLHSEVEPYLAVNPTNPNNAVAAWIQDNWSNGAGRGNVAAVTFDAGATWRQVVIPGLTLVSDGTYQRAADPWLSFAPNGDLYQISVAVDAQPAPGNVLAGRSALLVSKSTDGGLTWSNPIPLIQEDTPARLNDKPSLTADPTNANHVYAVWDQVSKFFPYVRSATLFSRSTDGGQTWEKPRTIYESAQNDSNIGHQILVRPDGTLVDLFTEMNGQAQPPYRLTALRSTDRGATWSGPIGVSPMQSVGGEKIADVAVDPHNGNLYAVWADARFSGFQHNRIAFVMSTDGGLTWSAPIRINQTPDSAEAFTPSIAVAQDGTVAVTYFGTRDAGRSTDVWIIHAHPGDGLTNPASWHDEQRLTTASFDLEQAPVRFGEHFLGDYQGLAAAGNSFYALWAQPHDSDPASIFFRDPPPAEPLEARGVDVVPADPQDWPMFGHDPEGSRYNFAETRLSPATVGGLHELWRFPTDGPVISTPAVVNDRVYAADLTGTVYALTRDGGLLWRTTLNVPNPLPHPLPPFSIKLGVSPLVTNRTVVIGDAAGQIQGLDVQDGHVRWTTRPPNPGPFGDQHPFQMILGAGTMVGNYVAFGVSSLENYLGPASDPNYAGYTFRGNVVLLDPADGRIVWQTFFVDVPTLQPDGSYGPSGATVWGSPAYDRASNTIVVGTGQHYGPPTTGTSDALIALDAATGAIKWVNQETPNDTWNITFGPPNGNDLDLGDSPQLYRLNGRLVVAAGQKSGVFHVVDAATGAEVSPPQQFLPPGGLGGFHTDSAAANGVNYAPGNHWGFVLNPPTPSDSGAVFAISGDGSTQLWKFDTASPMIAGVAVANGVVYFQEIGGVFHAVDAATGHELARVVTGSALSGPAVSRGQIYLGDGNLEALFNIFGEHPPGSIVALGLGGRSAPSPSIAGPSLPGDPDSPPVPPATGADPSALAGAGVRAAHPGGPPLVLPPAGVVRVDADTAGWGWLVGRMPRTDPELTTPENQDEQRRRSRLTVLAHELGHDRAEGGGKSETLPAGVRRTPAAAVLDQVFAALSPGTDSAWASDSVFALPQPKRRAGWA